MRSRDLAGLEPALGHAFADPQLLRRALTHSSADARASNERLEFLGDRVLGLILAETLYDRYPDDAEGLMALKFNALARREACAAAAENADLSSYLILAASEVKSGGRQKAAILSGATEAVIAALYLDGGLEAARQFILRHWQRAFDDLGRDMRDAKTALQEWAQGRQQGRAAPLYRVVGRGGPDHAPQFEVEVLIEGHEPAHGIGRSKREAEQAAARALLQRVERSS